MTKDNPKQLYEKFKTIRKQGDEKMIIEFLRKYLKNLPVNIQNKIILDMFLGQIDKMASEKDDDLQTLQKQGLSLVDDLNKTRRGIEEDLQQAELRKTLE